MQPQLAQNARRKPSKSILNNFLIFQIEKTGVEVATFKGSRTNDLGATRINPLIRLFTNGTLEKEELSAGKKYQEKYEEANLSDFAKPSAIYEGLPAVRSNKPHQGGSTQEQLDAGRWIFKMKNKIFLQSTKTINFKVVDLKLLLILEGIFELGIAVRNVEKVTGINHADIEDRIKMICGILVNEK